jgi:ABC-type hemin transport system substrate-binding protein
MSEISSSPSVIGVSAVEETTNKKKRERERPQNIVSMLKDKDVTYLIVDKRKRDPSKNQEVLYVARWGALLKKGEKPAEQHRFTVKSLSSKKKRKVFHMTRSEGGKFKMFPAN